LQQSAQERVVRPAAAALARQARRITPVGLVDSLERRLRMSGMSDRWTIEQVLAAKLLGALVGIFLGGMLFLTSPSAGRFLFLVFITGVFAFAPDVVLAGRADRRRTEIERALADALDQITICVEAGLSFEAALARVAQSDGALSGEFGRLLQDIQIGIPRARAMESLLERTDVPDLRAFVRAFGHAERYGIPIARVLRVQAAELRDKRRQRAEERALKIPVKLIFPVVLCILPALFVVLMGSAVMRISEMF
ncbi:MAG: type II secretion system F family protein, partial [Acidimicrobiia bacterium]